MSLRMVILLAALMFCGSYALHEHWDEVSVAIGLEGYEPSQLRAIDLAKRDRSVDPAQENHAAIEDRIRQLPGEVRSMGWDASKRGESLYLVSYIYFVGEERHGYYFEVDIASRETHNILTDKELAAKYGLSAQAETFARPGGH